jgi:positive regulator of sigma E activity
MIQRGVVQELAGGSATVAVGGGEGCGVCASRGSCMTISGKRPENKVITVVNASGARVGDAVELELPVSITMIIIAITFLLPVFLLLAGYGVMMQGGSTDGAVGAVSGLIMGMFIAVIANRTLSKRSSYKMRMTRILEKHCGETGVKK